MAEEFRRGGVTSRALERGSENFSMMDKDGSLGQTDETIFDKVDSTVHTCTVEGWMRGSGNYCNPNLAQLVI